MGQVKVPFQNIILFYLPAVGNPYCTRAWVLMLFLITTCKLGAGVTNFIISKAYAVIVIITECVKECVQNVPAYCQASLPPWVIYSVFIYSTCIRGVSIGPRRPREGSIDVSRRRLKSSRRRRPAKWPPEAPLKAAPDPEGWSGR